MVDIEARRRIVNMHYPCATYRQYKEWRDAARLQPPAFPAWFCTDCTPEYQRQMKAEGKCARPEVKFRVTPYDGIEGFIPTKHNRSGELF